MKKTLAIVLALVMVLAMIPAMSAHTTQFKDVSAKSYLMQIKSIVTDPAKDAGTVKNSGTDLVNSLTFEYKWSELDADDTGRYTEDVKKANVYVAGFDPDFDSVAETVTVDGKVLKEGMDASGTVIFPVELTEAGYTDTFVITVTEEVDGVKITETAKVSIVLKNIESKKAEQVAVITNVASDSKELSAYIVGDKLYLDFAKAGAKDYTGTCSEHIQLTFKDAAGNAFTGITYALSAGKFYPYNTTTKTAGSEVRMADSAAWYALEDLTKINGSKVKFTVDTATANYITKEYKVVVRDGVVEADPKGIHFAETTKTIAMGEKYTPVVLGVATGKALGGFSLSIGAASDVEVLDLIDADTVIGTREGVAYITASYTTNGSAPKTYTASSMKIVVTLPGESIPEVEPSAEIYYVTCRALNVRAGAGTSYKKVDLIHRGDAVKVVELKNGWAKLDNGTYVCAKYIAK